MEYLIGFGFSLVAEVVIAEFYGWLPKINKWLVRRATSRMPLEQRERHTEEWLAHLNEIPTRFSGFMLSSGLHLAVTRIEISRKNEIVNFIIRNKNSYGKNVCKYKCCKINISC